ncbi:MAG TPA: methyltransferase domain-containing protein [Bacteroidota bacterium]|nr:methyltransferase domain-containing protein [Bacteroidota bacterium]
MENAKGHKGAAMEGFIARMYNRNARRYSSGVYRVWAHDLADQIEPGSTVLEIAPGPGYLAIELVKRRQCKVVALDISKTFLEIARSNAREAGVEIDFRLGDVSSMPFGAAEFDFILCTSSFKNFTEPLVALNEMCRVLKPGGRVWLSDLRRDITDEAIDNFVSRSMKARGLAGVFMKRTFKGMLRQRAYTSAQFKDMVSRTPFSACAMKDNLIDFEASLRK